MDQHPKQEKFTEWVRFLKDRVEDALKVERNFFNHCLVQLYSNGESYISDHSDKTLDIKWNTAIVNVSLGAARKMKIKNKIKGSDGSRVSERLKMENGSLFVLGWKTNRLFYHGISQDKRLDYLKDEDELAFDNQRISLTFRNIATFMDSGMKITGQGARKSKEPIDEKDEALKMLKAFSSENRETDFDWDTYYGEGFDSIGFDVIRDYDP